MSVSVPVRRDGDKTVDTIADIYLSEKRLQDDMFGSINKNHNALGLLVVIPWILGYGLG